MFKNIIHNKMTVVGFSIVIVIVAIGILSPFIITADPMKMDLYNVAAPASDEHIWGTDELGRDIFSRVISGARTSLVIAIVVVGIGTVMGTLIGAVSGYLGGLTDSLLMKVMDILMAFPTILLALFFVTIFEPGLYSAIIGVGLSSVPRFARLVRGSVMNPVDHPHGGGEGRSPIGRPGPVTPWGKPTLGYKTRSKKNASDKFIVKRRNSK